MLLTSDFDSESELGEVVETISIVSLDDLDMECVLQNAGYSMEQELCMTRLD